MTDRQFDEQIRLIRQGEKQGLKTIYEEYSRIIYSVIVAVLHSHENAQDVVSEFFLKLWSIADTYCPGGKHMRWLVTVARNMAIDFSRKYNREQFSADSDEVFSAKLCDPDSSTENMVIEKLCIDNALNALDSTEREIVNLRLMADMSFKDIAQLLKKPMGTVSWKYRTAIGKLKKLMGEVHADEE
ncbi:MAG: RNA polymerase sigma factor [Oscillospiraceae bacterium]|jgi:RNA polymerase sigma-70 factor (ECF subfamily)